MIFGSRHGPTQRHKFSTSVKQSSAVGKECLTCEHVYETSDAAGRFACRAHDNNGVKFIPIKMQQMLPLIHMYCEMFQES